MKTLIVSMNAGSDAEVTDGGDEERTLIAPGQHPNWDAGDAARYRAERDRHGPHREELGLQLLTVAESERDRR